MRLTPRYLLPTNPMQSHPHFSSFVSPSLTLTYSTSGTLFNTVFCHSLELVDIITYCIQDMLDTNLKRTAHTLPFFSEFRPDID